MAPDRIDLIVDVSRLDFDAAWEKRICSQYRDSAANWVDLDTLIELKKGIASAKHQEDARVLVEVKHLLERRG